MKKLFILILFFISIKCEAQWFKLNASQIKIDSLSIIPTTNDELQVDSNWVKLFSGSGGSGEVNTASNLGGGLANFDSKSGVDLRFNSFKALDFDLIGNVISLDYTNGQAASSLQNGYLSSGDWSVFNGKQSAITTGTTLQYFRGDLSLAAFPTLVSSFTNDAGYLTSASIAGKLNISDTANMLLPYLRQLRTITINGTAQDLTADRTWSVGTVTNITATNNTGQTWTITNPTTTPDLSLALTPAAVGLGNVENTALSTWAGSANLITFGTNSVSNSELAQMANATVKGRNTAGTGDPEDVTMTQLQSLLGITNIIKSSDQTTASITMVDVSEIEFPVAANTNYIFEISGRFGCSSTQGMKVTMTTPAGATLECSSFGNAGTGLLFSGNVIITASGTESNTFGTNAVSIWLLLMKGSLRNGGTAGDVKLQFRSINGANTVTIFSGMTLTTNRIN